MDKSGPDAFGEAILFQFLLILIFSIVIRFIIASGFIIWEKKVGTNRQETNQSRLIKKITVIAYGILSGYYVFLFLTDFLENYQPAWEAYSIFSTIIIVFCFLSILVKKYNRNTNYSWLKNLNLFFHSLYLVMIAILIINFSFSLFVIRETNKIISKYANQNIKYCIQPKIDTWLDLTPLTTWNKKQRNWGATTNHAVLVIQNNQTTKLYNWSYKLKKWDYLTTGFSPSSTYSPSSLRCALNPNYSRNIPFLFPKKSNLDITNKKLEIPNGYFAEQKNNGLLINLPKDDQELKILKFIANPRSFSNVKYFYTKLPRKYGFHTEVYVAFVVGNQDLNYQLNLYPELKFQELKSEFGLSKRLFQKARYSHKYILYYGITDKLVNTLIKCFPGKKGLNCQHTFIHKGLFYRFNHSEKDLENWQNLQIKLVKKLQSWEIPKS